MRTVERDGWVPVRQKGSHRQFHHSSKPGRCVAAAATLEETRELMEETIEFHIEGMQLHGEIVPAPSSLAEMLEVASVR